MSEHFRDLLGEPLWKLVAGVGELADAEDTTSFPPAVTRRRAFRLAFKGGYTLKGRLFETPASAQVGLRIRRALGESFFPRVVAQGDGAMLEEWIEGQVLVPGRIESALIRECGRRLGTLHNAPLPSMDDMDFTGWDVPAWMRKTCENLGILCDSRAMAADRARRLENLVRSNPPAGAAVGIVQRDLCPENLVRDARGKLFCIDTGSLTIGPIDEDLCRVWYRWPMTDAERDAFAEGYRPYGDPAALYRPPVFWAVAVIVNSARFRLRAGPADTAAALQRLDGFLESRNVDLVSSDATGSYL